MALVGLPLSAVDGDIEINRTSLGDVSADVVARNHEVLLRMAAVNA